MDPNSSRRHPDEGDERGARPSIEWPYNPCADVLYFTDGVPRETVELDAGEGLFVRYAKADGRCVGITLFGVRKHLDDGIGELGLAPGTRAFAEEFGHAIEAVGRSGGVRAEDLIRLILRFVADLLRVPTT